jgi:glycosyltransferase involved in cell wall biosynthesis
VIEDKILLDKVRRTYLLPEKFILFFGNTAPKKNTKRVLEAYAQYSLSSSEILPLVITDCKESYIRSILRDINQLEVMNNIHVRDYIGFNDLPSVYNLAFIFLYPSLRESFGLPIIESMACGTPVITSNTSSMPEVAGDAAILINPENKDDIALAIERITIDSQKHERMTSAGLQRAGIFDWNSTAREVLKIYHLHQPPRLN